MTSLNTNNNTNMLLPFPSNYLSCISKVIRCIGPNSNMVCYYDCRFAVRTLNSNITNVITIIGVM